MEHRFTQEGFAAKAGLMAGKWAVCSIGRIGKIESFERKPWGLTWVGTGLDGQPWASRNPTLIAEGDYNFLAPQYVAT